MDSSLLAAEIGIRFELSHTLISRPAVVRLKNNKSLFQNRIGAISISIRILERFQNIPEMAVDTCNHRRPLLRLIAERIEPGKLPIGLVPLRKLFYFPEWGMRNLARKKAEKGLSRGIVVLCLNTYKIKSSKGINIIAIGDIRIMWVVL